MDIQFPQILFQFINFGVVFAGLVYVLFKPVKKMLDDRSAKIEEAQKAAEQTLAEKHQMDELKKKTLKDAEKQAAALIEEATKAAESKRKDLMAKAKLEITAQIEKERQDLVDEKSTMLSEMKSEFNKAVFATVEKLLSTELDKKAHQKLIDGELEQLLQRI